MHVSFTFIIALGYLIASIASSAHTSSTKETSKEAKLLASRNAFGKLGRSQPTFKASTRATVNKVLIYDPRQADQFELNPRMSTADPRVSHYLPDDPNHWTHEQALFVRRSASAEYFVKDIVRNFEAIPMRGPFTSDPPCRMMYTSLTPHGPSRHILSCQRVEVGTRSPLRVDYEVIRVVARSLTVMHHIAVKTFYYPADGSVSSHVQQAPIPYDVEAGGAVARPVFLWKLWIGDCEDGAQGPCMELVLEQCD